MEMMVTAFDVLFRYTVNMLKLKRPRNWHTIKFSNAQFKARADCMIGTRNILKLMGYTEPTRGDGDSQTGLSYPEPAIVNQEMIKIIGTELLTAKIEVKSVQESRGNFNYPLPVSNVRLENPHAIEPPRIPHLDDIYSSNIRPLPQQFSSGTGGSMSSGSYGSHGSQYSGGSHHVISQSNSYQPPSTGSYQYSNQSPGSSYGQGSVQSHSNSSSYAQGNTQPYSNEQYDYHSANQFSNPGYGQGSMQQQGNQQIAYQRSNESGYRSYHQSSNWSSETAASTDMETFSQPSSAELHQSSTAAKLAELRKKKEGIIQGIKQYSERDNSSYPPSSTTSQSYMESPATTVVTQPSNVPPSTKAAAQPKRPPVAPRTKLHVLQNNTTKHSEETGLSTLHEVNSQAQDVPAQRPPVKKRGPRIMMECNICGFLNHERCEVCVDCENSRNEQWRAVRMPNRDGSTEKLPRDGSTDSEPPHDKTATTVNKQPPPSEREVQKFCEEAASPNTLYNSQPSSVATNTPSSAAGASGTLSTPQRTLKDFVPAVKYTPEEKEEIRKQQLERDRLIAQQQSVNGGGAETVPLSSFVPQNDNYNLDSGERPTGNVLLNLSDVIEPEDDKLYKSLGNEGRNLVQDIKVALII